MITAEAPKLALAPGTYEVAVDDIWWGDRLRHFSPEKVNDMAESISTIGLRNPIDIRTDGKLVAGRHRLEAFRKLGRARIPAMVEELSDLKAELIEIDENLITNELVFFERCRHLGRRAEILDEMGLLARREDTSYGSASDAQPQAKIKTPEVGAAVGLKPRTTTDYLKLSRELGHLSARIMGTELADSKRDLMTLTTFDDAKQHQVLTLVEAGESFGGALRIIDPKPDAGESAPTLNDITPQRLGLAEIEVIVRFPVPSTKPMRTRGDKVTPQESDDAEHSFVYQVTADYRKRGAGEGLMQALSNAATVAFKDPDLRADWVNIP